MEGNKVTGPPPPSHITVSADTDTHTPLLTHPPFSLTLTPLLAQI